LKSLGDVRVDSNKALICIVGSNLKYTPGIAHKAFGSVRNINILMVSHGASNINLSFIVDEKDATAAMQQLHADFFREFDSGVFETANKLA
jgi:aspartate kinase